MNKIEITSESVYAIGDLHGKFETLEWFLKQNDIKNATIICCGDIGLGFQKKEEELKVLKNVFSKTLKKKNLYVVMFRGNHDNPERFDGSMTQERVFVVPDYTLLEITNSKSVTKNVLCIGGGLSIDRSHRIAGYENRIKEYLKYHNNAKPEEVEKNVKKSYWENELPVYNEEKLDEIIASGVVIDVVATHCAPSFCEPISKDGLRYWAENDSELYADSDTERGVMDKVFEKLKNASNLPAKWVYGHYHYTNVDYIDGLKFRMLDMVYDYVGDYEIIM